MKLPENMSKIAGKTYKGQKDDEGRPHGHGIMEYLTSGVTAIGDMYLTPETIADACNDMGMRCVLVSGLNKFGPALCVMEDRYNKLNGKYDLVSYKMGVHAEYTCSRELLEEVSELIHKYHSFE